MKKFTAKKIFIFSLMVLGVFFAVSVAGAQGLSLDPSLGAQSGLFSGSLSVLVAKLINAALGLLGLVALIIVLYGGYLYMTARGEAEKVQKAKKLLIQAVIGLLIIASSYAISSFILYILTVGSGGPGPGPGPEPGPGPGPGPYPLKVWCENPTPTSSAPYICSVKPTEQGKGGILTIRGGNFGDYDTANTPSTSRVILIKEGDTADPPVRYSAEVTVCQQGSAPEWNKKNTGIIKIIVPDNLPFEQAGSNKFKVYVENGGQASIDYRLDLVTLRNIFTLTDKTPSPEIICISPDNAAEQAEVEVIGKYLGADTQNKIIFNKNIEATSITSWADDLIKVNVPAGAIYGEVYIADKTSNKQVSDGLDFWVTCSSTTSPYSDCASGCCRAISGYAGSAVCDKAASCGDNGIGANCNGNTEADATCAPTGTCNEDLTCDATSCKCREPKVGDSCDSDATAVCQKDDDKCGQELVCATDCTCQESLVINSVTPNNGAPGNYITISGKGFGRPVYGNNIIYNPGYEIEPIVKNWTANASYTSVSDQASFRGSKSLLIDASSAIFGDTITYIPYSFYYKVHPLLNPGSRYSVSFKIKGYVASDFKLDINAQFGDQASYPLSLCTDKDCPSCPPDCAFCNPVYWPDSGECDADSARCCKYQNLVPDLTKGEMHQTQATQNSTLTTIPSGQYLDWQEFNGTFIYDQAMQEWVLGVNHNVDLGFTTSFLKADSPLKNGSPTKVYIDDFEVKEVSNIGQVAFCGADTADADTEKCGDTDDKIAQLPAELNAYCNIEDSWQDDQIIVAVPTGGVSGPIKVTGVTGNSDQTDNLFGTAISDFTYNNIKRPSLCAVFPKQGAFSAPVKVSGSAFGTYSSTLSKVYLGNITDKILFDYIPSVGWWWSDSLITRLIVPNLRPGTLPVWVKVGDEYSNPVSFKVLATAKTATIDNIDPAQGPTGQYITIQGSGFGSQPGEVRFYKAGEADPKNWVLGDSNFPVACANKYWSDTQIIIKVPAGAAIDAINGGIVVYPKGSLIGSNKFKFSRCERNTSGCLLTPGICSIAPNKAPIGAGNVVIYGDNFGDYSAINSKVIFFNDKTTSPTEFVSAGWESNQIGTAGLGVNEPIIVPAGSVSGPVIVRDSAGISSNRINFEVVDCRENADVCEGDDICCEQTGACTEASMCQSAVGDSCDYKYKFTTGVRTITYGAPTVIENYTCDNELNQSPSPWKNPTNIRDYACVNSVIYARFSMDMNTATFTNANIILNSCASDGQGNVVAGSCSTTPITLDPNSVDISSNDFSIAPLVDLAPSTWYQVTLKDNITSAAPGYIKLDGDKIGGAGGNYVWYFKTGDSAEDCQVDSVNVTPNYSQLSLLSQTQTYNGRARAANCNMLNGNAFDWNWYKLYCPIPGLPIDRAKVPMCERGAREAAQSVNLGGLAKISLNTITNATTGSVKVSSKQIVTPLSQGGVYIGAEADNKFDDTNILNIDLNLPIITGFTPQDGVINNEVNSYVDIAGLNFGDVQGSSKVYFEKNICPAGETICWTEAQLDKCGLAWTKTSVKVIVPKDVRDGAWIRLVTPFGESNTDFNLNNVRDSGETFTKSPNLYPFICQLNPSVGVAGINVAVIGDNFGDTAVTQYNNINYGVGSYINFAPFTPSDPFTPSVLETGKIKNWSNTAINYTNPLTDLEVAAVKVFAAIDPYSEPYNDTNNNGIYDEGEPFADTNDSSLYNKASYTVNGEVKNNLESNRVDFDQPPTITKLSPDNGPVRQWVTIIGKNFGDEEGDVYFGDKLAELALCETSVWTNKYIIAEVPIDAVTGNVYIITANSVASNEKKFTVNTNPLGAGLCSLTPEVGPIGKAVIAHGVRFEDAQGDNNFVFADNVSATDITTWSESDIDGNVPVNAESGEAMVVKKVQIGKKCAGFNVGSWCPGEQYETIYQDAPSNGIYFTVDQNEIGYCITDSDCLIANRCTESTCVNNQCSPEIISMTPVAGPVGQWVDIEGCYLGCQAGDVYFGGVQALTPSDANGSCANTWVCSANLNTTYDQITVEVPNKKTVVATDDAISGPVTLQTSKNLAVDAGNFTVNTDTAAIADQVCKLVTCGNNVLDAGEKCDGNSIEDASPWVFQADETCAKYGAPADCVTKCSTSCKTLVCNAAGENCILPNQELCGNKAINGVCSDLTKITKEACLAGNNSWTTVCSNSALTTKLTCLAGNNTWTGEQCDSNKPANGLPTDFVFETDETCAKYGAPADCVRKCNLSGYKCKTLICNKAGEDCSEPVLCGNGNIDGTCSNTSITNYQTCVTTVKSISTWNGTSCLDSNYTTKSTCEAEKNIWVGEQCDCGISSCYNPLITTETDCVAPKIWLNSRCVDTGLTTKDDCLAVTGNRWDWDCTNKLSTCSAFNYGTGNLGCFASTCKLNTSGCSKEPDTTPPFVEKTLPAHGETEFCRNGIIDIHFSELIDPATITPANFILGSCSGGPLVKAENGLINKALAYIKNILLRLAGYKTQALAENIICNLATFSPDDYTVTYTNIIDKVANPATPDENDVMDVPKTVVYLELVEKEDWPDIFAAGWNFNVGIASTVKDSAGKLIPAVTDKAGNALNPDNTPLTVQWGDIIFDGYAFGFATAGDKPTLEDPTPSDSGICDVDSLTINVYRNDYILDTDRAADENQQSDLFRCAGKNDCALPAGDTVTPDYDQDRQSSGNQHIYKAVATAANNGFHLSVTAQWSRSDQSDPARMLTLSNKAEDASPDNNIVRNTSGVVYTTINPISDKENTGLLVAEAQARGSQKKPPMFKIFKVDYLSCAYPWRFERDIYGNSKTWYCRDAKPLLPEAGILLDCSSVINVSACEGAPDCQWVSNKCQNTPCESLSQKYCSAPLCFWNSAANGCQTVQR